MLNIKIVGVDSDNRLIFDVNGRRGKGNANGVAGEEVHWTVQGNAIYSIERIEMKQDCGPYASDDIFSRKPPRSQTRTNWKGTINEDALEADVYFYNIHWRMAQGGHLFVHDPQISVKPSSFTDLFFPLIGLVGIGTLGVCLSKLIKMRH